MNIKKEFHHFLSHDHVHKIHYFCIYPEHPKAILQLEHGIAEHIGRYETFATTLAEQGFAVFADDHLGHGASVSSPDELCFFSESNGWQTVCQDIWSLHQIATKRFPDIPYFLMGHSMGSFLARTVALTHSHELSGLILSGTGHQSAVTIFFGRLLAGLERKRIGARGRSKLINQLAFGPYNKAFAPNRTTHDWLSRDPHEVDLYLTDPLCGADITVGLFSDILYGLNQIRKSKNLRSMTPNLPVLLFSGDKDPVGNMGTGTKKVASMLETTAKSDLLLHLYPDGRHELLNEPVRDQVISDLLQWLNAHC